MKMTFDQHLENRRELLRALDELYKKEKPAKKDTKSTKK